MKRFKIRYIRFLILFLFVFLLSGCASSAGNNTMSVSNDKLQISTNKQQGIKSDENGNLIVHFINVGQADSILIQQGSKYMLIDAGNNGDGKLVKNYLLKQGVKSLDYVIGTHPHEDHSATRF